MDLNGGDITDPLGGLGLNDVIGSIIEVFFALAGVVALFYIIIGGYQYITSGGNPEAQQMAKATITNAIIGLVIVLASYLVIGFVLGQIDIDLAGFNLF
jgi:hypothetical protein